MKNEIKIAINTLLEEVKKGMKADDALKFTQAACNLSHTLATITGAEHLEKQK